MPTTILSEGENQLLFSLAFCGVEVGDDAFAQRAHGADSGMAFAFHQVCLVAYGDKFVRAVVEGYYRRLVYNDFVVVDYDGIGRAQVNGYFFCK